VDLGESLELRYNPLVRRITRLPLPVVCAVNGVAAGAGANLAFAADIVLAARSAKFIQSFANIGLIPDSGGTWFLPRAIGLPRAMGLALTATPLPAEQAEAWGLIWKVVDDGDLMNEAEALCSRFKDAPTRGLAAIKGALRGSFESDVDAQLNHERDLQRQLGSTADYREGVAAFFDKRPPRFKGV
jgi:2-(1,2-epoxy-1,2-dihydrophenyl)acetyl-CoA isomerase